jgi:hypothetical protein
METTNIPWPVIALKLATLGKKPAWLALQLRTGTNTITIGRRATNSHFSIC